MKDLPWYIGRYDRRNDRFSYFKVVAQQTENGWHAIDSPKKMFPRTGEVELTGFDASQLRPNDWIVFQVDTNTRSKLTRAKHPRRIYPYYDLSSAQSLQKARHRLSLEGIETCGEPGQWTIRFETGGVILANLTESKPGFLFCHGISTLPNMRLMTAESSPYPVCLKITKYFICRTQMPRPRDAMTGHLTNITLKMPFNLSPEPTRQRRSLPGFASMSTSKTEN